MSVLVIGEALLDVFDGKRRPGGSPMSVAVGLARLGVSAVLHTSLGRDDAGQLVAEHLRGSGVHLTAESWTSRPTSVAEVQLDSAGNATYRFDITWDLAPITATSTNFHAVHIGSIGGVMAPGASVADAILESSRASAMLSYDLNIRPAIMASRDSIRERVEALIARIDICQGERRGHRVALSHAPGRARARTLAGAWCEIGRADPRCARRASGNCEGGRRCRGTGGEHPRHDRCRRLIHVRATRGAR